MSFRIAREQSLHSSRAGGALSTIRRDLAGLQEQLATGLRVNRPSDDPTAYAQARRLEALDGRYQQYGRTVDAARSWALRTGDALSSLTDRFAEAHEEGLRMLNDTVNDGDRAAAADRIDALLADVVDVLNSQSDGEYLFGGTRTTTAPFAADGTSTGDLSGQRRRAIGPDTELAVNVSGSTVTDTGEGYSITESLRVLAESLRNTDAAPGAGVVALDEAVGRVAVARDHLIETGAAAGTIITRLDHAALTLEDASFEAERRRSELEDADYVETITRFQHSQTALEAALRTTASLSQTTLLDYLR